MIKIIPFKNFLFFFSVFLAYSCAKDKVNYTAPPNCPDTVSFNQEVLPLIQTNCTGCHDQGNSSGGYIFTNHSNISSSADAILGSMHANGYQLMPLGGPALADSLIQKIECWIYQGKLNN